MNTVKLFSRSIFTLLVFFYASLSNAGLISRTVIEGLEVGSRAAISPAARAIIKNQTQEKNNRNPDADLNAKLDAISERLGKQSFSLVAFLFTYSTPGQEQITSAQYELAKKRFISQVSSADKVVMNLPLEINLTCTRHANDLARDLLDSIKNNKSLNGDFQYFTELRKCTDFLNRVKGYDSKQANSYRELADKMESIYKEKPKFDSKSASSLVTLIDLVLKNGIHTEKTVREESVKWLI
jgi:hypothetical protein